MKTGLKLLGALFAFGLLSAASQAATPASSHARIQPKVSMAEARSIALKAYPGRIVKEELERESGGSGQRYSFDMQNGSKWREVGVDAMTGQVLENVAEGANPKD